MPSQADLYNCALYLHKNLAEKGVNYYFCGGFACINVGMTARTTSDIDIAVPNGREGYGVLLDILGKPPFFKDRTGVLPEGSYYYFVETSGKFVEVDGVLMGLPPFPTWEDAKVIQVGKEMNLNFLDPVGLIRLKMGGWANETRRKGPKRAGDVNDMTSIRHLLISDRKKIDLRGLNGDEAKGLKAWVEEFKDLDLWKKLDPGYEG